MAKVYIPGETKAQRKLRKAKEKANKNKLTVVGKEGNVIQLNFNSDTKGSA